MLSTKLSELLERVWRSPIFGDAYAVALDQQALAGRMRAAHGAFVAAFQPLVAGAAPELPPAALEGILREIAPKTIALCATVALEVEELASLTAANLCFGLIYFADSMADRGDAPMAHAIELLIERYAAAGQLEVAAARRAGLPQAVRDRLSALDALEPQLALLSRPEDLALARFPLANILRHGSQTRLLSQAYLAAPGDFWERHGAPFVEHTITNITLAGITGLVYALYRKADASLPALARVFDEPALLAALDQQGNGALRIFDDVGDQQIDRGDTAWNGFHLNMFHEIPEAALDAFLLRAGVVEPQARAALRAAFQARPRDDAAIVGAFAELVRQSVAGLPAEIWRQHGLFMTLAKRFIESGYVNAIGDIALTGD
jgi:hypothetical protein